MATYKLQEIEDKNGNVRYQITVNPEFVDQLGWEGGDTIKEDIVIGGRDAGKMTLDKIEEPEEE